MFAEDLAMGTAVVLPTADVGDEHARAGHVLDAGAEAGQRLADDLETAQRLRVSIAGCVHAAVLGYRGGAGHEDLVSRAQRAAVSDLALPGSATEVSLERH